MARTRDDVLALQVAWALDGIRCLRCVEKGMPSGIFTVLIGPMSPRVEACDLCQRYATDEDAYRDWCLLEPNHPRPVWHYVRSPSGDREKRRGPLIPYPVEEP